MTRTTQNRLPDLTRFQLLVMENIGHLVKCHECGYIVLGNGVIEDDQSVGTDTDRSGGGD